MSISKNSHAFTLVELMLAISILGIIIGVVASTFHVGVTAWRAGTSAADSVHRADAVMEQVYMALRSSYYPESNSPQYKYGFVHTDEGGDLPNSSDVISWVKLGNALIGEDTAFAGVPHRVELFIGDGSEEQGPGLYVRSWRLDGHEEDFDPYEDVSPILVSREVIGLDCKVLDPEADLSEMQDGDELPWIDDWEDTNRIPEAVWISMAIESAESKREKYTVERFVEIPMADLSWHPTVTSGNGGNGRFRGRGVSDGNRAEGEKSGLRTKNRSRQNSSSGADGRTGNLRQGRFGDSDLRNQGAAAPRNVRSSGNRGEITFGGGE